MQVCCRFLLPCFLLACFCISAAHAHSRSSSRLYLEVSAEHPEALSIDIAIIDLLQLIELDRDADGSVRWDELTSSDKAVVELVLGSLRLSSGNAQCLLSASWREFSLVQYSEVPHLRIRFGTQCAAVPVSAGYSLSYSLLQEIDPSHRALLRVIGSGQEAAYVLSPGAGVVKLAGAQSWISRAYGQAPGFVGEGFRHILSGYDHLVFLLLMIMPAAAGGRLQARLLRVGIIVTAFTLAHSITLAAATTGLIQLPPGPAELAIAASIVVAAAVNIFRPSHTLSWKIAFAFGLLHGFGFAGALAELDLDRATLLVGLLAFNVGVELGQLLVVALILPVLAALAAYTRYRSLVVPYASLACAVLGTVWTAARWS